MDSKRRWSGFVCPECRFVFRVSRDHDGTGIVCPCCRRLMRIPGEDDTPSALLAPIRQVQAGEAAVPEDETNPPLQRRHGKNRRKAAPPEIPSWEIEATRTRHGERRTMKWILIGGIPLFAVIVVAVVFALRSPPAPVVPDFVGVATGPDEGESIEEDIELPQVMKRSEPSIIGEAEPLARAFLEATDVKQVLPLIHDVETVEPRLRRHYPDGKIEPVGLSAFNTGGGLNYRGSLVAISVRTREHEQRQLAFVDGPEGLKIDWESWVGWSDMTWEDFIERSPSSPHTFRVVLQQVEYYNFAFTDEDKWQSYTLVSPDGEYLLYGYAEKGSVLNEQLRPSDPKSGSAMMLGIKYPEARQSGRQVLIDSIVAEGWVQAPPVSP